MKKSSYMPVDPDYFETIEKVIAENNVVAINFFNDENKVDGFDDEVVKLFSDDGFARYIQLKKGNTIRVDRIITLKGLPGPAFDEYDHFALECLSCMGGMDHLMDEEE